MTAGGCMLEKIAGERLGKYKGIIISVALFLLLDASVLILNFYISFEISDDASAVNVAGRQRMLSQRMTKSLFDMQYSLSESAEQNRVIDELIFTKNLFDSTLNAFASGGVIKGADGRDIAISEVTDSTAKDAVSQTLIVWEKYKKNIEALIFNYEKGTIDRSQLADAIRFGSNNNLLMLKNMNVLTITLENIASSKATTLRLIQTVGISLAILNFFIIMFHFVKQLKESDQAIESARRETEEILDTVNEGLFLVDSELNIGSQFSTELTEIIGVSDIAGTNFRQLLTAMVSQKDLETTEGFIELLFNPKIKEKLIQDLNPLDKIQVNIETYQGHFNTKYLSFSFARVIDGKKIINILVTVNDITDKVALERELDILRGQEEEQLEMLTSILHTNGDLLQHFLKNSFQTFRTINDQLRTKSRSGLEFRQKTDRIFREIHNFKGESSALRLDRFSKMAHEFEDALDELRTIDGLTGNDFLGLTLRLENMISYTQSIDSLVSKLGEFNEIGKQEKTTPFNPQLHDFLSDLCNKTQKQARLFCSGLYEYALDDNTQSLINDITIQFMRNAVAHGIELPDERRKSQKPRMSRIDCHLSQTPDGKLELIFEDDGSGIDYDAIRQTAMGTGKWSESEIEGWDNKKLISLIFSPGFSTVDTANYIAGRGIGMDIVKQKINHAGGKLQIRTRKNAGTKFTVTLPLSIDKLQAA